MLHLFTFKIYPNVNHYLSISLNHFFFLYHIQAVPGFVRNVKNNFSDSFFSEQLNLEDQNRFIPLAKYTETRTPSTGSKITSLSVD